MDPEATLTLALERLTYLDFEECEEALDNYWSWRSRGGFEPERGDARARQIAEDLREIRKTRG